MRVKSAALYLSWILVSTVLSSTAHAEYALHFWENHHTDKNVLSVTEELSTYITTSNFDLNGDRFSPIGFNQYLRIENNLNFTYGLNSRWSTFGTLSWGHVEVDHAIRGGNTYGLTDQLVGMNFELFSLENTTDPPSPVNPGDSNALRKVYLQAQMSFPGYSNSNADLNKTPWLGDQSIDFTTGAFTTLRLIRTRRSEFFLTGGAGYTYRSLGFSSAIPWTLALSYIPLKISSNTEEYSNRVSGQGFSTGWQTSLSLFGNYSLHTDMRLTTSAATGGSYISDAMNPSLLTVLGKIGYALSDNLMISTRLSQSIYGLSAPNGLLASINIQKLIGLPPTRKASTQMSPEEYGKSNKGFVEYTFEAKVLRAVDRLNLVKIDKGNLDGVMKDQIFDIFAIKADGTLGEPIARTKVISTKPNEAALTVIEYFKETWIEEGFIAKRPLQ